MKFPVISVSGSPYQLGYQHGKQTKKAVRKNFRFYLDLWKYFGGIQQDEVVEVVQKLVPYIKNLDSGLIEEIKGLAEGAEMQFEEVVALNCRYELSFAFMSPTPKASLEGCTSYALTPEATQNQYTLVGQNSDYKPGLLDSCIILRIKQEKKPDIIMYTAAGIIGHKGFNSAGIGVCANYIRWQKDTLQPGLSIWIKVRGILNSESLIDCMKILMTFEGPNSINLVIAHRDGEAVNVECTPDNTFFLYPERGILTHANNFLSHSLRVKDTGKLLVPDSVIRSHRVHRLFQNRIGNLNSDTIKDILKDHFGHPASICRHRDERFPPNEQWETLTSMIIDLTEGKLLYTIGPPCSNPYETITMDKNN